MLLTEQRRKLGWGLDAVEQRHHAGLWPKQRGHSRRCIGHLPALNPYKNHIHRPHLGRVSAGLHRLKCKVALDALDPQAAFAQRMKVSTPGDKG